MLKIGLTGGIGTGKSVIAEIFRVLGIPVFKADDVARDLQNENEELKNSIKSIFGNDIYINGKLDRAKVSAIVFDDKEKLKKLNAAVHPAVAKIYDEFCRKNSDAKYIIKEAAILIEIGDKSVDKMILVTAPEEIRIRRVMKRDNISEGDFLRRMKNQWTNDEKLKYADVVILNDGKEPIMEKILQIHEDLMSLSI
ncbi:MAG: dephospho-CoA kinase [Bacteroidetes bacterium]|nr:dephospho-CoA kinase [Bacteroidota bacterium]